MAKFRTEKYIKQYQSKHTGLWSFRVRYKTFDKIFNEKDYLSSSMAFKKAVEYRNNVVANKIIENKCEKTIYNVLLESYELILVRMKTKTNNLSLYKNHVGDYTTTISNISSEYITNILNKCVGLSDEQISRIFALYKRIEKTALVKKYISSSVTQSVIIPKSHKIASLPSVNKIDKQSIINVINACDGLKNEHYKKQLPLIIKLLAFTGMRPAELFALNKNDVDNYIHINKELGSSVNESTCIRQCKTKYSIRDIPLTKQIKDILLKASELSTNELLFPNDKGDYYDIRSIGNVLHRLGKSINVDINLYDFRHYFASVLITNNVDPRSVQELMGHSSKSMTIYYANSDDKLKKNALSSINFG